MISSAALFSVLLAHAAVVLDGGSGGVDCSGGAGGAAGAGGAGGSAAPAPHGPAVLHAQAYVNDSRSHGQVGDSLLSLNEVIQLHNGTLLVSQLSAAEQNQISAGTSTDIAWGLIDGSVVPVITIERDLDVIQDRPHGLQITGYNQRPVLDFSGSQVHFGFRSVSNYNNYDFLGIHGGPFAIDLAQTDAFYGSLIRLCEFDGQSQYAIHVSQATANQNGRVLIDRCNFVNMPSAVVVDEQASNRTSFFYLGRSTASNVTTAAQVLLGPGGSGTYWFELLDLAAGTGIQFLRQSGQDRAATLYANQLQITGGNCFEYVGAPTSTSNLTLRMLDLHATAGGHALTLGPLNGRLAGVLEDSRIEGTSDVATGGAASALSIYNWRCKNGTFTFGSAAGQALTLEQVRFDNCTVASTGQQALPFTECCVVGGSLSGAVQAPIQCTQSFVQATVGSQVTQGTPRPAAQLGSFQITPQTVTIPGPLTFQADLPPGFLGVFALGLTTDTPVIQPRPIHVYTDPAFTATIPGTYALQQSFTFQVPNNPQLLATDFTAQMVVLPNPGVQGPYLSLPPGKRFVLH